MKLFTFTDLHGDKTALFKVLKKIKKSSPNLILCAGDLTNFGINLKQILIKLNHLKIPILIIPGNHESLEELNKALHNLPYIKNIHKKVYILNDYLFFGYGLGGFESRSKDLEKIIPKLKKLSENKKVILLTHQPPYKTKLDHLPHASHQGNKSILKLIQTLHPLLAISGHLHENENKKDKINSTFLINPGANGKVIEI